MSDRLATLERAHLYLVCDERSDAFLEAALRGGVQIVQLRAKDAGDVEIIAAARRYLPICRRHAALLILNDRPDLVGEAGADGVHVGQDDVTVARARELVGPGRILGLSTHSPAQIDRAGELDVDYIGVGPIYATPTKPGRQAVGLELVRYAATHARRPFFAIGGIESGTVDAVRAAGARRIAVVRALTDAPDPEPVARALRRAIATEEQRVGAAQP